VAELCWKCWVAGDWREGEMKSRCGTYRVLRSPTAADCLSVRIRIAIISGVGLRARIKTWPGLGSWSSGFRHPCLALNHNQPGSSFGLPSWRQLPVAGRQLPHSHCSRQLSPPPPPISPLSVISSSSSVPLRNRRNALRGPERKPPGCQRHRGWQAWPALDDLSTLTARTGQCLKSSQMHEA
jgi:hypothetical protein